MNERVISEVNKQIQSELQSAYLYLAMSVRFEELALRGAAQWMRTQWEEEIVHAMKFFDFLVRRGETPHLMQLAEPEATFETALEGYELTLKLEKKVTQLIHALYDLALAERDYPLQTLLHWFIDEQVEEEESVEEIIQSLKLAGDSGQGLFLIDRELGTRTTLTKEAE